MSILLFVSGLVIGFVGGALTAIYKMLRDEYALEAEWESVNE